MALDDFTGQNIQDTYQRVVQTTGGTFADGTGSILHIVTSTQTGSFALSNNITGSFTAPSSSFSTRITNLKSDSGSFSTRVTLTEASASNIVTDSGSFSTRVTLTEASASNLKSDSGSFSTRVTDLEDTTANRTFNHITSSGNISASGYISASTMYVGSASFAHVDVQDDIEIEGQLFIGGFALEALLVSVTTGSTQFGSSSLNNHGFTGSVSIQSGSFTIQSGSLDVSGSISAHSFIGTFAGALSGSAQIATEITGAFTDNSSSLSERITNINSSSLSVRITAIETNDAVVGGFTKSGITGSFTPVSSSISSRVTVLEDTTTNRTFNHITSSGNISASLTSTGSFGHVIINGDNFTLAVSKSAATHGFSGGGGSGTGFPFEGNAVITGSLIVSGSTASEDITLYADILPGNSDEFILGSSTKKWNSIFATNTFFGGIHEVNLETKGLDQLQQGVVLVSKAGKMVPCTREADPLVMGIVSSGSDYPIILGAEPVLVTGTIYEGDYIITSNTLGHGKGVHPDKIYENQLFGKIIAQSLETKLNGGIVRAMIRKL